MDYQYWPSGRLYKRYWERGTNTTYTYNYAGEVQTVDYSDTTPDVTYSYDRRGRQTTVLQNGITTTFHYDHASLLLGESYAGGTLNNLRLTNVYDAYFRRTNLAAQYSTTPLLQNSFGFDTASRLLTVTDGTNNATYAYLANSPLISQITLKSNTTTRMTTTRQYDLLNRLQSISSSPSSSSASLISFSYLYNDANQRVLRTESDASRWVYDYDKLGQVTSGKKYWLDGSPVPGQQFEYGFDDIGNRTSTKAGRDANGANLRSATYTRTPTNTYSSRTVPGGFDVVGLANNAASVTVNSSPADYRRGEYFQEALTVANGSAPV